MLDAQDYKDLWQIMVHKASYKGTEVKRAAQLMDKLEMAASAEEAVEKRKPEFEKIK